MFTYKFVSFRDALCIRVTVNKKSTYKSLGFKATKKQVISKHSNKPARISLGTGREIDQERAQEIVNDKSDELDTILKDAEKGKFLIMKATDVLDRLYTRNADTMRDWCKKMSEYRQHRPNTAHRYAITINKLESFKPSAKFEDINRRFLDGFDTHLQKGKHLEKGNRHVKPNSYETRRKEINNLRDIWNFARKSLGYDDMISPFHNRDMKPDDLSDSNKHKILTKEEIKTLRDADLEGLEAMARDAWVFSYGTFGMRIGDVLTAKPNWFRGDKLSYQPAKRIVKTTKGKRPPIRLTARPYAIEIMNAHKGQSPQGFIFPVCKSDDHKEKDRKASLLRKYLRKAAQRIGINPDVSFHWARHSAASYYYSEVQKKESVMMVLGHANVGITDGYLESLGFRSDVDRTAEVVDYD